MRRPERAARLSSWVLAMVLLATSAVLAADEPGTTRVARWQGDKACALVLMFDDSIPSHVRHVVPELTRRGFTGTFYINPGTGHYASQRQAWERDIPAAGCELGNHTMRHGGGATAAEIAAEISACNEVIHRLTPKLPWPRLVSWGQPGGIKPDKWPVSKAELAAMLRDNRLIDRPDFGRRGAMIGLKTSAAMLAHVDRAIADRTMECIIFHGVGGGWLSCPLPMFVELLDGLVARRDRLWVTAHIAAHQYATERDTATVKVTAREPGRLTLLLTCTADPQLYSHPLTLLTTVPADWTTCRVDQGQRHVEVRPNAGTVRYDAMPGDEPIMLSRGQ